MMNEQEMNKKISDYNRKYYESHKTSINAKSSEYKKKNKDMITLYNKKYYKENKEKIDSKWKEYYENNKETILSQKRSYQKENKVKISLQKKSYDMEPVNKFAKYGRRINNWQSYLISSARHSAKKRGIEFNISENDIIDPAISTCPIFHTKFEIGAGKLSIYSATIDRIDNSIGYIPGNVWVISALANRIKHEAGPDLIRRLGHAIAIMESNTQIHIDMEEETRAIRQKLVRYRKSMNRKHNNLPFCIQWFDISAPTFCPCFGVELDYHNNGKNWRYFATIDRIDNTKGYIPGNVWVISSLANIMKTTANSSQILMVSEVLENAIKSL
jgi:hypothetical protein